MPCTLQPWEEEIEERRINKEKYGLETTDFALATGLLCEACKLLEVGGIFDALASTALRTWWKEHKRRDRKRKATRSRKRGR